MKTSEVARSEADSFRFCFRLILHSIISSRRSYPNSPMSKDKGLHAAPCRSGHRAEVEEKKSFNHFSAFK